MKKILLILILLFTTILFISCKENNNPNPNGNNEDPIVDPDPNPVEPDPVVYNIVGEDSLYVGEEITLLITGGEAPSVIWSSSDDVIATVSGGIVKGIGEGTVTITAKIGSEELTKVITVLKKEETPPEEEPLSISCKTELIAGEITEVKLTFSGEAFDVNWSSSDPSVAFIKDGFIFALKEGATIIKATKTGDSSVRSRVTVRVSKYQAEEPNEEDLAFVRNIMKNMTIEEMIGQLVMGSEAGTTATSNALSMIQNRKLGNFIFMGNNT